MNIILVIFIAFLIAISGAILSVLILGRIDDELPTLTTVPVFIMLLVGSLYVVHAFLGV